MVFEKTVTVQGRPARILTGGSGHAALLLLHGGWGGAQMHWSRVWGALARSVTVIAPDLPGLGDLKQPGLSCLGDYVAWLNALLDELGVERAFCIGNSFGASLAWSFAGRSSARCTGLVLVDGIPMPRTPAVLLALGRRSFGRALMRSMLKRTSFTPRAQAKAFANVANAPLELNELLTHAPTLRLETFLDCLIAGDGPPEPRAPTLVLWGEDDHLPGTGIEVGRKLAKSTPGARFVSLPGAGHFPQLERPEEFVRAVEAFVAEHDA